MAVAAPKILLAWTYLVKFGSILILSGPKSAVRRSYFWLVNAYADWSFDRRHNTDTFGEVPLASLNILDKNFDHDHDARRYQQTPVIVFRAIMSTLPIAHNEYVFVDFGSGKGKVILMASEYNFQKIVGVEFAEELHRIAQQNLAKYSDENQRCYDIELVLADAADFPIPDQKCVFFLFNPFKGAEHVLAKVIDNIYCSYCANPRTMYFVYFNPISKHLFDELDFVRLRAMQNYQSGDAAIYETSCDWMRRSDEQQKGGGLPSSDAREIVLSLDEQSQVQALDRTQPGLPMKPGRAGTMTHDDKRNGTTTLFAALDGSTARSSGAACSVTGTRSCSAS